MDVVVNCEFVIDPKYPEGKMPTMDLPIFLRGFNVSTKW